MRFWHIWILSGERQSAIITTIIGGGLESSSRSLPFLFIAKKRDGAVQQRGLMSRFYSFWGTFSERKNGIAYLFSVGANPQPVAQRIDTKVSILLGLRFPLFLSLVKIGERQPLRKRGAAENLFYRRGAHCASFFRSAQTKPRAYGDFPQTEEHQILWKNAFAEKFCFQYNKYVKTTVYIVFCVFHQQNRRNGHGAD